MISYPYDEHKAVIDKETFTILSQHFELIPDFKEKKYGRYIFIYEQERVNKLSTPDLLALSPYLFQYRTCAFNGEISPQDSKIPKVKEIVALMKKHGITRESFLDAMIHFEFSQLGNESAQTISAIARDIEDNCEYLQSEDAGRWFYTLKDRHYENTKTCAQSNGDKEQPFELERIIKIESAPIALDYAPDGRLYVLDQNNRLHEFEKGEKTCEWKLQESMVPGFYKDAMDRFFSPILPNISVKDRILFLAHGSNLVRYDLENMQSMTVKPQSPQNALALWQPELDKVPQVSPQDIWFHDVCLKDGN
ncbi:MAG: hypothetical protein Q7K45_06105, partial [Nanoarchaeota archaeon]|nr:hypothetical protein [Nanoarchaeota archaeon]